jgi:hypothetical protein
VLVVPEFDQWTGFLNPGCGIEEVWKSGAEGQLRASVSHVSHMQSADPCGRTPICVKSVFRSL